MEKPKDAHIVSRYDEELNGLRGLVLEMGASVVAQVRKVGQAFATGDLGAARQVVHRDRDINELDMEAQERSVGLFAIRQPVARDLRLVFSLSRMTSSLERAGDEAKKIARIAMSVYDSTEANPNPQILRDVQYMAAVSADMMEKALAALRVMDLDQAVAVIREDRELDSDFQDALRRLSTFLFEDARNVGHVLDVVLVLKALERVGDHAVALAKHLVFAIRGKDVRHIQDEQLTSGFLDD